MLSREDNELVTRTGPGTPMGNVLRRYWMPVAMSRELEPDGEPLEVKILGEDLVAFRDTAGDVGVLDLYCPHRRASLWLGRNEEHGLRCVFHGWKFAVGGSCTEMPSEPTEYDFKERVRNIAYPTVEVGDVVWVYMGPPDKQPAPPAFEWATVPSTHRHVDRMVEECNWLQALEGGVDSAHSSFLHRSLLKDPDMRTGFSVNGYRARGGNPLLEVELTDWGYTYASIRDLGDEGNYVRTYQYIMPFTQARAQQFNLRGERTGGAAPISMIGGHMWVPMDDENCMVWNTLYHYGPEPLTNGDEIETNAGRGPADYTLPDRRKVNHKDIRWGIDREMQRNVNYTGIVGANTQDHAVHESMGRIVDRSKEQLGTIDRAIIATRRLLIEAARTVEAGGDPPGIEPNYGRARAIEKLLAKSERWQDAMSEDVWGDWRPRQLAATGSR
jgi:phenylpropionate dioxygenase-like ring-hydroxylating dioxygenase large terminal subunit